MTPSHDASESAGVSTSSASFPRSVTEAESGAKRQGDGDGFRSRGRRGRRLEPHGHRNPVGALRHGLGTCFTVSVGRLRGSLTSPQREQHTEQRHPLQRPATASRENRSCPACRNLPCDSVRLSPAAGGNRTIRPLPPPDVDYRSASVLRPPALRRELRTKGRRPCRCKRAATNFCGISEGELLFTNFTRG